MEPPLSVSLFINTLIIKEAPSAWWRDPVVALGCGIASLVYGTKTLYNARKKEHIPIFSLSWWFLSQGDGADATSSEPNTKEVQIETTEIDVDDEQYQEEHAVV